MKKLIASLIIPCALSGVSHAIVTNGTGGGNWTDTATWDGGTVPTTGRADVTGGDTVTVNADSSVGGLIVGFVPGTGDATLNIDNNLTIGSVSVFNGTSFWIGAASRNGFVVQADNTTVSVGGKITIGGDNDGTYTMGAGAILNADFGLWMGSNTASATGGNGILTINGGTVNVGTANGVVMGGTGDFGGSDTGATININSGGLLSTQQIAKPTFGSGAGTTARINIDGGTLQSSASNATFMQGLNTVNILSGGATIDTQAFDISIGQALLEDASSTGGGLTKIGSGNLTLTDANTYTGTTLISGGTLQLGDGGTTGSLAPSTVITNNGDLTINRSDSITQSAAISSSIISGTGSLTKTGAGNLIIDRANTYSGDTIISGGTLTFAGAGTSNADGAILVQNGGTLSFARNDTWGHAGTTNTADITIDTGGVVQSADKYTTIVDLIFNGGTLSANDGVVELYPTFGLRGTVTVNATAGGSFISTTGVGDHNTVAIYDTTFDVADGAAASDLTVSAPLSRSGAHPTGILTKTGAGTMTLSGANTYTGGTTVNAGTLVVDGSLAAGNVFVATGATLAGSGSIGGATTVNGFLNAGNSPGILTFSEDLSLGATSVTTFEIASLASFDILANDGGDTISFADGASIVFSTVGYTASQGDSFQLLDSWDGYIGSIANLNVSGTDLGLGLYLDTSTLLIDGNITVVPEASSYALLAGLLGMVSVMLRRRRRS